MGRRGAGGACILSGKATFTDSTISGNWSNGTNHNAFGTGIENYGTLTVTDCVIRDNSAYFGGGVYNRGTAAIQNSTIWNNYAFASGGGLYNATGGTLVVSNSTISNNWADCSDGTNEGGGGIFNTQGTLTVTNSTVANNHGCYNGGGIYNDNGPLTVKNSIVASNVARSGPDVDDGAMTAQDALYSLIGVWDDAPLGDSNKSGTSSMPLDPELDDWTQFDNGTWGYDLLAGSPAVDAGDNTNASVTDQRGFARIVDGNGEGVSQIDMGAIEYLSDAALPVLSIGNVTQTEGDSGTKTFTFTVSLSGTNTLGASVSYATADGTATAGSDYVASNGMLSWPAGDTSRKTISVTVNGDTTVEPDEGFTVTLSVASGNTQIITPTATGTVLNDDNQPPTVEANPTSVTTDAALATAVTLTAAATGTPAPTVTWQMNTGSGFTDLSNGGVYGGVTTTTLTVTGAALAMNGYQYRAVFTNGTAPDATTAAATLTVNAALGIAPTTLPAGVANTLYHQTISVSGGTTPYTSFTVSGFSAGGTGLTLSEITANAPDGSGTLSSATVYARISASATANVSGNLTLADALHSSVNKSLAVSGTVNPVVTTPPITWSNPADITYGKALGATQLDATTSVPGWFSR